MFESRLDFEADANMVHSEQPIDSTVGWQWLKCMRQAVLTQQMPLDRVEAFMDLSNACCICLLVRFMVMDSSFSQTLTGNEEVVYHDLAREACVSGLSELPLRCR